MERATSSAHALNVRQSRSRAYAMRVVHDPRPSSGRPKDSSRALAHNLYVYRLACADILEAIVTALRVCGSAAARSWQFRHPEDTRLGQHPGRFQLGTQCTGAGRGVEGRHGVPQTPGSRRPAHARLSFPRCISRIRPSLRVARVGRSRPLETLAAHGLDRGPHSRGAFCRERWTHHAFAEPTAHPTLRR